MRHAIVALTLLAGAAGAADAGVIFGLNRGDRGGGIYSIDTATGNSVLYRSTPSMTTGSTDNTNALAYDAGNDRFYYITQGTGGLRLVRNDSNGETVLGNISGLSSLFSATFHGGSYWVVPNAGNILEFTFAGNTFNITQHTLAGVNGSYGDIASDEDGETYAVVSGVRRFDLNNLGAGSSAVGPGTGSQLQLGFGAEGLFGVRAVSGGGIYSINTGTGVATLVSNLTDSNLIIQDAASSVPTPGAIALFGAAGLIATRRRKA